MNKILQQHITDDIVKKYQAKFYFIHDEAVIKVSPKNLVKLIRDLRDDTNSLFSMLVSICGVDYPNKEQRFEVIYNFLSLKLNERIRLVVAVNEKEKIPSIADLFNCATWYEREVYDMYGVEFSDCKDMRRILTDYNFNYHPLRKDYPLTGYDEVRYDIEKKKIVYEKVQLDQEYRNFDFVSPWEGDLQNIIQDKKQVEKAIKE
jgi:NADH-quinone oxidoreductase subunit C